MQRMSFTFLLLVHGSLDLVWSIPCSSVPCSVSAFCAGDGVRLSSFRDGLDFASDLYMPIDSELSSSFDQTHVRG